MTDFKIGDRVVFKDPTSEARAEFWGKAGEIERLDAMGRVRVQLDEPIRNRLDWDTVAQALEHEVLPPTEAELAEVYASLASVTEHSAPTTPPPFSGGRLEESVKPSDEARAVAAFLQGGLAMTCQQMITEPQALKIARVEQLHDPEGNYQDHFTVITESGIRIKVQVTPEEG